MAKRIAHLGKGLAGNKSTPKTREPGRAQDMDRAAGATTQSKGLDDLTGAVEEPLLAIGSLIGVNTGGEGQCAGVSCGAGIGAAAGISVKAPAAGAERSQDAGGIAPACGDAVQLIHFRKRPTRSQATRAL